MRNMMSRKDDPVRWKAETLFAEDLLLISVALGIAMNRSFDYAEYSARLTAGVGGTPAPSSADAILRELVRTEQALKDATGARTYEQAQIEIAMN
jgi:hypothetical protein